MLENKGGRETARSATLLDETSWGGDYKRDSQMMLESKERR